MFYVPVVLLKAQWEQFKRGDMVFFILSELVLQIRRGSKPRRKCEESRKVKLWCLLRAEGGSGRKEMLYIPVRV
jgi:hypothetical protein